MVQWLIATPCWGARCVKTFLDRALPAVKAAIECQRGNYRFIIHTDARETIAPALSGYEVQWVTVPSNSSYQAFPTANKDALRAVRDGERLVFINADIVVSRECFEVSERRFTEGKRAIAIGAVRSLERETPAPVGASAIELREWAISNLHPVMREFVWTSGRSAIPSILLFRQNGSAVLRAFHIHPFAVVKDRDLKFNGATTDSDLLECFQRSEIHVVGDPSEMAIAELSPADREPPPVGAVITPSIVATWATRKASSMHRWFFSHRLRMAGSEDCGDDGPGRQILGLLGERPS